MKKLIFKYILIVFLLVGVGLESCNSNQHFITDKEYRDKVELQFEKQKKLAINREVQLFDVFKKELSIQEIEALKFLYAYMPLSDLADYDGEFYLKNVYEKYSKYEEKAKKQAHQSKTKFSFEEMKTLLGTYLDKIPKQVGLTLPKLKKIEVKNDK
jgi:hypothetical protein